MKSTPAKASVKRQLKSIDLPEAKSKKKKGSDVPTLAIEGDKIKRYTEALLQIEQANAVLKELKPDILEVGIEHIFEHNCEHGGDTKSLLSSVKLFDAPEDAEDAENAEDEDAENAEDEDATDAEGNMALMVTVQKKVGALDRKAVNAALVRMRRMDGKPADVNDYVEDKVVSTFDASVFNGADGEFDPERYAMFVEALQEVSDSFGVDNPLSSAKVLVPKGDWHERRWVDFDLDQNLNIQSDLMPSVTAVKAVALVTD